jgi:hypothetical protein
MTVKQEVMALIEELPEETTLDEIEYHLYVRKKLDRADEAIKNGNVISHESLKERVASWL